MDKVFSITSYYIFLFFWQDTDATLKKGLIL